MAEIAVEQTENIDEGKRDFIHLATGAAAAVGAGALIWPFIAQMDKAADTRALGSIEINLSGIAEGSQLKTLWRGKPVFVRHRTAEEIAEAEAVDVSSLPDPATDASRLVPDTNGNLRPEYLVMVGVCTHFGCIPVSEHDKADSEYNGWYCPCHGSHYDTSGRIRKGPAPANMEVPTYSWISDTSIKVG